MDWNIQAGLGCSSWRCPNQGRYRAQCLERVSLLVLADEEAQETFAVIDEEVAY